MISQGQNSCSSGSGGNRSQQQLDQLELTENENRYETESQATTEPDAAREEQLQILNRLKELAQRQEDFNQRTPGIADRLGRSPQRNRTRSHRKPTQAPARRSETNGGRHGRVASANFRAGFSGSRRIPLATGRHTLRSA